MSDQSNPAQGRGINMWLLFGLVASLALNAFFFGAVVGGKASTERWSDWVRSQGGLERPEHGPPGGPGDMFDPRDLVRVLPETARADAIDILERDGQVIRDLMRASGEARYASFRALRADPYSAEDLETAFAASRAADAALLDAIHSVMAEIMAGLDDEERAYLNQRLEERGLDFQHGERHRRRERREGRRERFRDRD